MTAKNNVSSSLVCNANMELVPNIAGCPPQPIQPVTNYYVVRDCNTNEDYVFATTNTYGFNVRLVDGSNNYYIVNSQGQGQQDIQNLPISRVKMLMV